MAQSPAHQFGQIIGDTLESTVHPLLEHVAKDLGIFLDVKGIRPARAKKRKVVWVDGKGNAHDLDYVFEAGGSAEHIGSPRAFIEVAWRRYTKHSRNKAQEIQGAILPLAERYSSCHPFLGVVLGGVFTEGSLEQLRSNGFIVVYFPYETVVGAFRSVGVDAAYDEGTPDRTMAQKVRGYQRLSRRKKDAIAAFLRRRHKTQLDSFVSDLRTTLIRRVDTVYVLPLHGKAYTASSVAEAIGFIESFEEAHPRQTFVRYEVGVRYNNGDEIRGQFGDKTSAIDFLRTM